MGKPKANGGGVNLSDDNVMSEIDNSAMRLPTCLSVMLMLLVGCSDQRPQTLSTLQFARDYQGGVCFDTLRKIEMQIAQNIDTSKFLAISRVRKRKSGDFLVLCYPPSIFHVDTAGRVQKRIASHGRGPGEFTRLADFALDENDTLFAFGENPLRLTKFDPKGVLLNSRNLQYAHRNAESIEYHNGAFILGTFTNLRLGSDKDDYGFLPYEKRSYLALYDKQFILRGIFANPSEVLGPTEGLFHRPYVKFAPFALRPNTGSLFVMLQEGFYVIQEYNIEGKMAKMYEVTSSQFTPLNMSHLSGLSFNNGRANFTEEKIGSVIASHSSPTAVMATNRWMLVKLIRPYENYFPMYSKIPVPAYYYDLFRFHDGGLKAEITGIEMNLELVGSNFYEDEFYFTRWDYTSTHPTTPTILVLKVKEQ